MLRNIILATIAVALAGCVSGQYIQLDYEPAPGPARASAPFSLTVTDKREYVTSGDKDPWYIGHYRAGFGNTWDVTTYKKTPLADQMKNDLRQDLLSLGFVEGAPGSAKSITVTIHDWNFDAYINGRVWYDVQIEVKAPNGKQLAVSNIKDEQTIEGNIMTGAKSAMTRQVPVIYGEIIRKLVRENPAIINSLGE